MFKKIMKKAINNYLNQYKEVYSEELYFEMSTDQLNKTYDSSLQLQKYYNKIKNCMICPLGKTRTNFVFGVGNRKSNLVFVGEAPGENEDLKGEPFVGKSGKLLDKILKAISLSRKDIYICNIIKCRPPKNRNPLYDEIEKCRPYLDFQLKLIQPKVIIALGKVAANTLLNNSFTLNEMRGNRFSYLDIDLMVTYHPAALLRNPNFKKPCWEDFQMIQKKYL